MNTIQNIYKFKRPEPGTQTVDIEACSLYHAVCRLEMLHGPVDTLPPGYGPWQDVSVLDEECNVTTEPFPKDQPQAVTREELIAVLHDALPILQDLVECRGEDDANFNFPCAPVAAALQRILAKLNP